MKKFLLTVLCFVACLFTVMGLTACKQKSYKVTFVVDGSEYFTAQTSNGKIQAPVQSPTKTGYTFQGWSFDFENDTISADTTIVASFTANSYTVNFVVDGEVLDSTSVIYDQVYGQMPSPSKLGHSFDGWFTRLDGGVEIGADSLVRITETQSLYAKFTYAPTDGIQYTLSQNHEYYICSGVSGEISTTIFIAQTINDKPVKQIGSNAFKNSAVKSVYIPSGVEVIDHYVFYDCSELEEVYISNTVTSIGEYAFRNCKKLKEVQIDAPIVKLSRGLFEGCESLQKFVVPNQVTEIDLNVFRDCTSLQSVELNQKLTRILDYSFENCTDLQSVVIPSSVNLIGANVFLNCTKLDCIILEKPNGWSVNENTVGELTDGQTVARLLTEEYLNFIWQRS